MRRQVEIFAYRLTSRKYAHLLDGAGAASCKRNRWNQQGQFVTYAASSRALALLEMRVHSAVGPPKDAVIAVIRIVVEKGRLHRIGVGELPEGWSDPFDVGHCQIRGAQWYNERAEQPVMEVPSAIVPEERIYVIRGGAAEAEIKRTEEFVFDPRLWKVERTDHGRVPTIAAR